MAKLICPVIFIIWDKSQKELIQLLFIVQLFSDFSFFIALRNCNCNLSLASYSCLNRCKLNLLIDRYEQFLVNNWYIKWETDLNTALLRTASAGLIRIELATLHLNWDVGKFGELRRHRLENFYTSVTYNSICYLQNAFVMRDMRSAELAIPAVSIAYGRASSQESKEASSAYRARNS